MTDQQKQIEERLELGLTAALEAEKVILSSYQDASLKVSLKQDKTVVTEADREAEKSIRAVVESYFKDDGILGEELGEKNGSSGYAWILDPIDGTQSFICGVPLFGTLIGITYRGEPVAGIAHMPALNETYYAALGQGAWWRHAGAAQPVQAQASQAATLKESLFCTTSLKGFDRIGRRDLYDKLISTAGKFRGWGSCYGHMLVATGRADLMIDPDVKIWDLAAILPIVTEAGGAFYDLNGEAKIDGGGGISSSKAVKDEILNLIHGDK